MNGEIEKYNLIMVTGADSGLGLEIANLLEESGHNFVLRVHGPTRPVSDAVAHEDQIHIDLTKDDEIRMLAYWARGRAFILAEELGISPGDFYPILVNCAGINYIDWFPQADFRMFDRLMDLNVKAGLRLVQCLIGEMPPFGDDSDENWFNGTGCVLNIVSNASHVPMTNSAFYNASKGAFHIATLALARELRKTHGLCVFGISPNKLKGTGMSDYIEARVPSLRGWTPEEAAKYQLAALPAGEETDPKALAEFIAFLLCRPHRHKYLTNTILPYGA